MKVGGVTIEPDGTVRYDVDLAELEGAVEYVDKGKRLEDGTCEFSDEEEGGTALGTASTVTVITELSFDEESCTREMARADYGSNSLPPAIEAKLADNPEDEVEKSVDDDGGVSTLATRGGSIKVNVEDPLQIDVSSTKSALSWTYNGSKVTSARFTSSWGWFKGSGWARASHSRTHVRTDAVAYMDTKGTFINLPFCDKLKLTSTNHSQTYWSGRKNGVWYWSYRVSKGGDCAKLLHFEKIIQKP